MIEGTELDSAYNLITIEPKQPRQSQSHEQTQYHAVQHQSSGGVRQSSQQMSAPMGQLAMSTKQQGPPVVYVPNAYTPSVPISVGQGQAPQRIVNPVQHTVEANLSYVDSLISKRRTVMRMVGLSIIILLAISLHSVIDFGLREVVIMQDLGFKQEFGVRILYPIAIVLIMWSMKSFGSSK